MKTVQRNTKDLIPYVGNQKKHPKKQITEIAAAITEFGWTQPIVLDEKDNIIIGHGRLLAAQLLKLTKVPCVVMAGLTEQQVMALRINDNKLNESPWDKDLLKVDLEALYEGKYDMDLTGFSLTEISNLGVGLDPAQLNSDLPQNTSDKSPFQQSAFTLSDDQYEVVQSALAKVKKTTAFKNCETFGNANRNGNALYVIIQQWIELTK